MDGSNILREFIGAARGFHSRKLWRRFTNYDCFLVRLLDRDETLLASVMGDAGEQFGLLLLRGPNAAEDFAALTAPGGPGDGTTEEIDMISFCMEPFGELDPDTQGFYRRAGLHPRVADEVPNVLVKRANRMPRIPDDKELALLIRVTRAAAIADARKLLEPTELDDAEGVCVLSVSGDETLPDVSVTRERPKRPTASKAHVFGASGVDLSGLRHLDATWLVSTPTIPAFVEGDDRSMQILLAADRASGIALQAKPFFSGEAADAIEALVEAFHGRMPGAPTGIPRRIVCSDRKLYEAIDAMLGDRDVTCTYEPMIPELQELMEGLLGGLEETMPFDDVLYADQADDTVPAADDLPGWKAVDLRLVRRFSDFLQYERPLWSSRAARRYFGEDDLDYYFEEYERLGVIPAYAAWGVVAYRPTYRSRTQAEKMLAGGLPPAEEMLLRARTEAYPSLYRVADTDPQAGTVYLENVLLGGGLSVDDQLLSENIDINMFLPVRVFPAGQFRLIDLAGPLLGMGMGQDAVKFLRDAGVEFSPEGLNRMAHVFGRLWDWAENWKANRGPVVLRNMDEEDIVFQTASFSIADPKRIRRELLDRDDIDFDEENDEFVWSRASGGAAEKLGGPVTLARMEFVGDELVVTTNSVKRFEEARCWLTRLPGVAFRGVTNLSPEDFMKRNERGGRASSEEPIEITPEMAAGIQDLFERKYMQWIDTPLPVLNGQTPRQACATPAGRQKVTTMIRTMPEPVGNADVTVPRQAMLHELRLESEAPPSSPRPPVLRAGHYESNVSAALPSAAGHDDMKVGRNDTCPCGSGRKYKECCGGLEFQVERES